MQMSKINNFIEAKGHVDVPEQIHADFALICKGDDMINARIFPGDIVLIREQNMVESGEIAAVLIDGEVMLKRVQFFGDRIVLKSENPHIRPLVYWGNEMDVVRFLGVAVAFISCLEKEVSE